MKIKFQNTKVKSNMRHFLLTIVIVLVIAMGLSSCLCL